MLSHYGQYSQPNPSQVKLPQTKWWILLAIGTGTLMSALDGSVVNITLPVISQSFKSSITAIEWVVTIYLLVLSALLLTFGRLGDMFGHKNVYLAGFLVFLGSSVFCALATSVTALVITRAIQAFGAAMLAANSPAILTKSFPTEERGRALGLQATMTYVGLTIGPSLGGWLTSRYGWQSVFLINVPIGALAIYLSWRFIQSDQATHQVERFDIPGALTFMIGLTLLLLGLNQGGALGWTSPTILALLAASLLLFARFISIEKRVTFPMLDLSLFRHRIFSAAVISAVLNYACVYSILFLLPFYLQQGRGLAPWQAGLILTAQPITMALIAPISGAGSDRMGTRLPSLLGMIILSIGCFLLSRLGESDSIGQIGLALAVAGLGTGMFISPNNSALMGSAPRNRQGVAAGILATSRNFGMVLGVGMTGAVFSTFLNPIHSVDQVNSAVNALDPLFHAIRLNFLIAMGIALVGAAIAAIRQPASSDYIPG